MERQDRRYCRVRDLTDAARRVMEATLANDGIFAVDQLNGGRDDSIVMTMALVAAGLPVDRMVSPALTEKVAQHARRIVDDCLNGEYALAYNSIYNVPGQRARQAAFATAALVAEELQSKAELEPFLRYAMMRRADATIDVGAISLDQPGPMPLARKA